MTVAPLRLSSPTVASGQKLTVTTYVSGGKPPLLYAIVFGDAVAEPTEPVDSGGWIVKEVTVPPTSAARRMVVRVVVQDSDNRLGQSSSMVSISPR
jgi:hypothetical protein